MFYVKILRGVEQTNWVHSKIFIDFIVLVLVASGIIPFLKGLNRLTRVNSFSSWIEAEMQKMHGHRIGPVKSSLDTQNENTRQTSALPSAAKLGSFMTVCVVSTTR